MKWLERELRFSQDSSVTSADRGLVIGSVADLPAVTYNLTGDAVTAIE